MEIKQFKKEFKGRAAELGVKVAYPRKVNGIKIEQEKGVGNEKFDVLSEANIKEDVLILERLTFGSHGSYDNINSTKWIIEYWVQYATIHNINKIKFNIHYFDSNGHGGWNNQYRIGTALQMGFKVNNVILNPHGNADMHELDLDIGDFYKSEKLNEIISHTIIILQQKDNTIQIKNGSYERNTDGIYPISSLFINWEGFKGDIRFFEREEDLWFEIEQRDNNQSKGRIEFNKYDFNKNNIKEKLHVFFQDLKEKQSLINLVHPPCGNLFLFVKNYCEVSQMTAESIMIDFMNEGYTYSEIESEFIRIMNERPPSKPELAHNPSLYGTDTVFCTGLLKGDEIIVKICNHYLVCLVEKHNEKVEKYAIVKEIDGVNEFFSSIIKERIQKMLKM